jgi:2'-5' RNA ligase
LEKIRSFIAVPMSQEVNLLVGRIEDQLREVGADVKWVTPDNVHVTLKFLGNIVETDVAGLTDVLGKGLAESAAFDVALAGVGTFPQGRKLPRVVWVGLEEGKEALSDTAVKVEAACTSLGFEGEDRPFKPHLTIGRVRRGSPYLKELAARAAQLEFNPLKVHVDRVNLMRSKLSPKGPTYTVLNSFTLASK